MRCWAALIEEANTIVEDKMINAVSHVSDAKETEPLTEEPLHYGFVRGHEDLQTATTLVSNDRTSQLTELVVNTDYVVKCCIHISFIL